MAEIGKKRARAPEDGSPNLAAVLTWVVPGAGHALLGRYGFALAAFLIINGLYLAGLELSGGMTFEFLDLELRGPFATVLTPEAGNLGGLIYQMRAFGYGPEPYQPRLWPAGIHAGSALCALSGLANLCLMTKAHWDARAPHERRAPGLDPAFAVLAAWAVPGLGHWLSGRRRRALLVAGLLLGLFTLGTWLAEGSNLSRERHFYYWGGQFLVGLPALVAEFLSGRPAVTRDIPLVDAGLLFGCIAGLLNVLAMLDVYTGIEARRAARVEPTGPSGAAGQASHVGALRP